MGFGFNLIGFPLLLLATGGLVIYAIVKQSWKPLLVVAALWSLTILMFITATIADHFRTPIRLKKADIIGEYRIDNVMNTEIRHPVFISGKPPVDIMFMKSSKVQMEWDMAKKYFIANLDKLMDNLEVSIKKNDDW